MRATCVALLAVLVAGRALGAPTSLPPIVLLSAHSSPDAEESAARRRGPRSIAYALLPFGIGQLANEDPLKGALFLLSETLAFGVSAATLAAFETNKLDGSFLGGGRFRDPDAARSLQTVYLISFWGGVALAGGGVLEALVSRRAATPIAVGPGSIAVRF
jgi:hypothetical protein